MGLYVTASEASVLAEGVWGLKMPPHQVRMFGNPLSSKGSKSILLVSNASFDLNSRELHFEADGTLPLNVGTGSFTIAVSTNIAAIAEVQPTPTGEDLTAHFGPGDQEFLRLTRDLLPTPMQNASVALLRGIRARSAGDLKRGKSKNFSETPDNFWYVIVQPRVEQLSVTIRGPVAHFRDMAELPIKDDRGNTLFKVTHESDVPAALDLIFHAKRKV